MFDFDVATYVEGLELELSFATDPGHRAEISAELARVTDAPAAPAAEAKAVTPPASV